MSMGQTLITVLLGLLALVLPTVTFLYSSKANRMQANAEALKAHVEEKGVDAQAYDRAARLWEEMVSSMRQQVDRLEASNTHLSDEVASLRETNANLVMEISTLQRANATLRGEVMLLRSEIDSMRK